MDDLAKKYANLIGRSRDACAAVDSAESTLKAARAHYKGIGDDLLRMEADFRRCVGVNVPIRVFDCGGGFAVVVTHSIPESSVQYVKVESYTAG